MASQHSLFQLIAKIAIKFWLLETGVKLTMDVGFRDCVGNSHCDIIASVDSIGGLENTATNF